MSKTRLPLACCLLVAALGAVSPVAAQPSNFRLDSIEKYVRGQLDGNVVGYQFAIAHNGNPLRSYSYGMANLRDGKTMKSSYRLNIGSVSKIVTTVTVLKLAELGELDLDEPFTKYLRVSAYEDAHESIKDITIRELLTYTARLPYTGGEGKVSSDCRTDCPEVLSRSRELQDCRVTLDIGESRFPYRCAYAYQNASFHLSRLVIQGTRRARRDRVDTTEELVALTRDLWLDDAELAMDCDPHPSADMRYYTTCDMASYASDECGDSREGTCECLDGTFLEHRILGQSNFCSSGGWRASATDLVKLLARLRDGQILGPEMTDFLLDSNLEDGFGNPGSTSAGWDRPWTSDEGRNLSKNGSVRPLLTAYATYLPDGVTAALLINTENKDWPPTPGAKTAASDVVRGAWKSTRDPRREQ